MPCVNVPYAGVGRGMHFRTLELEELKVGLAIEVVDDGAVDDADDGRVGGGGGGWTGPGPGTGLTPPLFGLASVVVFAISPRTVS
ncbi:hypothetical protein GGF42_008824, partial [Coemansia sp. RSA 2424]